MAIPKPSITQQTKLKVNKPFKCAGRRFEAGKVFNHRSLVIPWHKVKQLYEQGYLLIADLPRQAKADATPKKTSEGVKVEVVHKGGGWFNVMKDVINRS